ncbi:MULTISPECIES: hypothetical protein [Bartonella]|uniref:Uncharacterized protein n=1 Tax=Bartonella vinsonii subsp. berkhoffii str. Tweed TaxID=1094502 RepID=N6US77_BARVB|nr:MULTISPECIES: hypothetical protein [Bartonella]ENN94802.1 hypothetical protein BVtw_04840 [Bartonella vinsonii subsp. berkhoffii str. Tweed]ENN95199.1 hypothetical protein BVtw_04760 [Bartonella vinsonii subsp. berkhoffii str. Tweed]
MDKSILINSDEILLVVCDDDQHIGQSGPLDENQILGIVDEADDTIKIFRINPSENSCEDISEEIAEAYIKENRAFLDEDSKVDYYVCESPAYNRLLDEIADEKYNDAVYGTYEEQHRLTLWDVLPNYPNY